MKSPLGAGIGEEGAADVDGETIVGIVVVRDGSLEEARFPHCR